MNLIIINKFTSNTLLLQGDILLLGNRLVGMNNIKHLLTNYRWAEIARPGRYGAHSREKTQVFVRFLNNLLTIS